MTQLFKVKGDGNYHLQLGLTPRQVTSVMAFLMDEYAATHKGRFLGIHPNKKIRPSILLMDLQVQKLSKLSKTQAYFEIVTETNWVMILGDEIYKLVQSKMGEFKKLIGYVELRPAERKPEVKLSEIKSQTEAMQWLVRHMFDQDVQRKHGVALLSTNRLIKKSGDDFKIIWGEVNEKPAEIKDARYFYRVVGKDSEEVTIYFVADSSGFIIDLQTVHLNS